MTETIKTPLPGFYKTSTPGDKKPWGNRVSSKRAHSIIPDPNKKKNPYTRKPVKILFVETGEIKPFESMKAAAEFIGCALSEVSNSVRKGYRIRGKFIARRDD